MTLGSAWYYDTDTSKAYASSHVRWVNAASSFNIIHEEASCTIAVQQISTISVENNGPRRMCLHLPWRKQHDHATSQRKGPSTGRRILFEFRQISHAETFRGWLRHKIGLKASISYSYHQMDALFESTMHNWGGESSVRNRKRTAAAAPEANKRQRTSTRAQSESSSAYKPQYRDAASAEREGYERPRSSQAAKTTRPPNMTSRAASTVSRLEQSTPHDNSQNPPPNASPASTGLGSSSTAAATSMTGTTASAMSDTQDGDTIMTLSHSATQHRITATTSPTLDAEAKIKDILARHQSYTGLMSEFAEHHTAIVCELKDNIRALEVSASTNLAQERKKNEGLADQERLLSQHLQEFQTREVGTQTRITELQERIAVLETQEQGLRREERILQDLLRHVLGPILGISVEACVGLVRSGRSLQQAIIESSTTFTSYIKEEREPSEKE
ncbi:hypothetical protein A1O3_10386 [Capronia epimyces CBS 606.96]|uniref:Uncharacterized protein n=1 Tax=Capronia epimyces CBS 606.96 TaxID=1182542 RepID=W9XAF5_9EURO|nr:uncharacterized protein A1O3_10386 [Capronia epimyces CBS 606.96]EXJ77228.1 hypothetical protein A1O3_10386 [Capronia epimyces CBS 606.96]